MKITLNEYLTKLSEGYTNYMFGICEAQKEGHLSGEQPYWEWVEYAYDPDIDLPKGAITLQNSTTIIQQLRDGALGIPTDLVPLVVAKVMIEEWALQRSEKVKNEVVNQ